MSRTHIYVCSPSAPFNPEHVGGLDRMVRNVHEEGFDLTLSDHCLEQRGNVSSSIENRVRDLEEGFTNDQYDVVMASRGGWNSNEILPHLDYSLIARHPKFFIGMSDMTTLCVNLYQKSGVPTVYGPMLLHFGLNKNKKQLVRLVYAVKQSLISENSREGSDHIVENAAVFRGGDLNGRLLGGNLAVLCWLIGTPYELIVQDDTILFLEDDEETNGYYWQLYLTHLKQRGVFEKVRGVIVGRVSPSTTFMKGSLFEDILNAILGDYQFPILIDAPFGHIDVPQSIVYGQTIQRYVERR